MPKFLRMRKTERQMYRRVAEGTELTQRVNFCAPSRVLGVSAVNDLRVIQFISAINRTSPSLRQAMKSNKHRQSSESESDEHSRKELSDEELREALAEALEKAQALLKSKNETGDSEKPPVDSPLDAESDLIH